MLRLNRKRGGGKKKRRYRRRKLERKCSQYMDNTLHISGFDRGMVLTDTSWPAASQINQQKMVHKKDLVEITVSKIYIKLNYTSPLL